MSDFEYLSESSFYGDGSSGNEADSKGVCRQRDYRHDEMLYSIYVWARERWCF